MPDYEKGSASWDIGMILTRHHDHCARREELRVSARGNLEGKFIPSPTRLQRALDLTCTCGMGDSPVERTSLDNPQKENSAA